MATNKIYKLERRGFPGYDAPRVVVVIAADEASARRVAWERYGSVWLDDDFTEATQFEITYTNKIVMTEYTGE